MISFQKPLSDQMSCHGQQQQQQMSHVVAGIQVIPKQQQQYKKQNYKSSLPSCYNK
jgi:hypothetical protein